LVFVLWPAGKALPNGAGVVCGARYLRLRNIASGPKIVYFWGLRDPSYCKTHGEKMGGQRPTPFPMRIAVGWGPYKHKKQTTSGPLMCNLCPLFQTVRPSVRSLVHKRVCFRTAGQISSTPSDPKQPQVAGHTVPHPVTTRRCRRQPRQADTELTAAAGEVRKSQNLPKRWPDLGSA
jgi:hypothetical protein